MSTRWEEARVSRDAPMPSKKLSLAEIHAIKRAKLLTPTYNEMQQIKRRAAFAYPATTENPYVMEDKIHWGDAMSDWVEAQGPKKLSELKKLIVDEIKFRNSKGVYPTTAELLQVNEIHQRLMTQTVVTKPAKKLPEKTITTVKAYCARCDQDCKQIETEVLEKPVQRRAPIFKKVKEADPAIVIPRRLEYILLGLEKRSVVDFKVWEGQRIWRA